MLSALIEFSLKTVKAASLCVFAEHSLSTTEARHATTSVLSISATLTADTLLKLRLLIVLDDHSRKLV